MNVYEELPEKADVILFNSHHKLKQAITLKSKYSNKILLHRVDGPIFEIRNKDREIDNMIYYLNNIIADATIFQSNWSKKENYKLGMKKNKFETTIINAPDPKIFNKKGKIKFSKDRKIRLIATSWSGNWKKGFDVYKYLDENIDFSKHDMTFIGNSPINFNNIKWIKPLSSLKLAKQLKQHDIFITASQKDPCSNSLIEALSCGLPAIALNDGGHPEIVQKAGEFFINKGNLISKIEKVVNNYKYYQNNIKVPTLQIISKKYLNFIKNVYQKVQTNKYTPKKIDNIKRLKLLGQIYKYRLTQKILKFL